METKGLYLVVYPFKAGGAYFEPGKVLSAQELSSIRLFKIKLNEGKIVPMEHISKAKFEYYHERARLRWGADVKASVAKRVSKGSNSAGTQTPQASTPTTGTKGAPDVKSSEKAKEQEGKVAEPTTTTTKGTGANTANPSVTSTTTGATPNNPANKPAGTVRNTNPANKPANTQVTKSAQDK